jgi:GDP-4-dehydro-6-deoxy-D-mannose reductase
MRVLISGITGFVGRHLTAELERAGGFEVTGFAPEPAAPFGGAEVVQLDVLQTAELHRLVERCDPEVIVHLGGLSHVGESWQRPGDYLRVNFGGTLDLLRAAGERRVIFASSAEVYGQVPESEQPIAEEHPLAPRSPYAMTKACAERLALEHGATVVRSFNAVGAGQSMQFALPSFAAQLAAIRRGDREPVLRVGDLSPRRDFVHVEDAAVAYRLLIEKGEVGTVYNLATGRDRSIAEMLDRLRTISGVEAEVHRDEARVRPVDVPLLCGDRSRLEALGWRPRRRIEEALGELWQEAVS